MEDHHDGEPLENRIRLQCNSPKLTAQRIQVLVLSHCKSFSSSSDDFRCKINDEEKSYSRVKRPFSAQKKDQKFDRFSIYDKICNEPIISVKIMYLICFNVYNQAAF